MNITCVSMKQLLSTYDIHWSYREIMTVGKIAKVTYGIETLGNSTYEALTQSFSRCLNS
jgi:hypothetical protein